jgi:nicotinamidase/pyrazinamidase
VKWTAEDAVASGFRTSFLWDLSRSVDPSGDDELRHGLEAGGVQVV